MKLYHGTDSKNIDSILREGLKPNSIGIVYLSPTLKQCSRWGNTIFEVETGDLRLTAFPDCSDWEVLCWGKIPPENIKLVKRKEREMNDMTKVLIGYEGKWVGLSLSKDDQMVVKGSGDSIAEAISEAKENGEEDPILLRVPLEWLPYILPQLELKLI